MSRLITLIFIAVIAFAVILFIQRPEMLEDVWLWLLGFAGPIVKVFRDFLGFVQRQLGLTPGDAAAPAVAPAAAVPAAQNGQAAAAPPDPNQPTEGIPIQLPAPAPAAPPFKGITLTVLRYSDDGATTVGLLYINGKFYCYTLEDTHRAEKVAGQTRIPAGIYPLDFNRQDTPLTLRYRERYPEWFRYHLHIQKVPGYEGIYIHNGGDHTHTEGCLLVSDSLSMSEKSTVLTNSRNTFKRLYQFLEPELHQRAPVRVVIKDESWFQEHYA